MTADSEGAAIADVRKMLAEIAPELAQRIRVHNGYAFGRFSRDEFMLIHRAVALTLLRAGKPSSCESCAWAAYRAQKKTETGALSVPCTHRDDVSPNDGSKA